MQKGNDLQNVIYIRMNCIVSAISTILNDVKDFEHPFGRREGPLRRKVNFQSDLHTQNKTHFLGFKVRLNSVTDVEFKTDVLLL